MIYLLLFCLLLFFFPFFLIFFLAHLPSPDFLFSTSFFALLVLFSSCFARFPSLLLLSFSPSSFPSSPALLSPTASSPICKFSSRFDHNNDNTFYILITPPLLPQLHKGWGHSVSCMNEFDSSRLIPSL